MARLEHVNITVSDPKRSAALMDALFGWKVRWEGEAINGGYTVHVGNNEDYIAFYAPPKAAAAGVISYDTLNGLNHVALVVDDLDTTEAAVVSAGYTPTSHGDYEPGRRFYFRDHDNVEYEIVSYA